MKEINQMKPIRGKNGKFMRDWRTKLVKQMAAQSRAAIERGMDKPIMIEPRQAALNWHISYLNKVARELRVIAKRESRGVAVFDRGNSYSVGINPDGHPFVQINFTVNGGSQCANYAI